MVTRLLQKILTWQFGDRKSHNLIVLSNEPEINVSSTGDMERDVTLVPKKKKTGKNEKAETSNSPLPGETSINKAAQMQRLPFAMPRKVADVFVVMEGEVPDCILKNNKRNELHLHTSNFNTQSRKETISKHLAGLMK